MANLSVRVPKELQEKLDHEAEASRRPRSELVREAISEYVVQRERERLMADMERAAHAMATADPAAIESAEEFLSADLEVLSRDDEQLPEDEERP